MKTVAATEAKNRFGRVLEQAMHGAVAIERHGRVVAYVVPARDYAGPAADAGTASAMPERYGRAEEEPLLALCASRRLDAGLWRQHGSPFFMAGLATLLASAHGFPRERLLALARELYPGMADDGTFGRWLERSPLRAARFLPMLRKRLGRAA